MTLLRRLVYAVAAPIILALIRLLWSTYRFRLVGDDKANRLVEQGSPLILTFWHDSVFILSWYLRHLTRSGVRVTYLVSPSMDGELGVRLLSLMRSHAIRGSATRSGVKAMRDLYRAIVRHNASPVILPDGPQGPRHHCKPGSLLLAQLSGAPVLPMATNAGRSWHLPTWDRLQLPLPFSRVTVAVGEPFTLAPGLDAESLEEERQKLEQLLGELGKVAKSNTI
jgi:lysophospholipid acyltransferase (LPLAT)-like uncharacterized protein